MISLIRHKSFSKSRRKEIGPLSDGLDPFLWIGVCFTIWPSSGNVPRVINKLKHLVTGITKSNSLSETYPINSLLQRLLSFYWNFEGVVFFSFIHLIHLIFSHNIKFTPFATKYRNKIIIIITICGRTCTTDDSNKIFLVQR